MLLGRVADCRGALVAVLQGRGARDHGVRRVVPVLDITANGVPHQRATPAADRVRWEPQYALPYQRSGLQAPEDVLIVGAGSGTDVAIALQNGARHVDAVEIDPGLLQLGRERHPDRPYQEPAGDDARQRRTRVPFRPHRSGRYDLILFALPDSLTLVHGASSLRLESYLFTVEAFRSVQQHLKPGGAFAMYNYYREPWLIDRLALTAQQAFGHQPCVDDVGGEAAAGGDHRRAERDDPALRSAMGLGRRRTRRSRPRTTGRSCTCSGPPSPCSTW